MIRYHDSCAALIKQINDGLEKQANRMLREDDLTIMQVAVLVELDGAAGKTLSLKELEHRFGVAQPTMLGIVKRLEQKVLVEMLSSAEDRRIRLVHLTGAGMQKCQTGYDHMEAAEDSLLRPLDDGERAQFRSMLERIKISLQA